MVGSGRIEAFPGLHVISIVANETPIQPVPDTVVAFYFQMAFLDAFLADPATEEREVADDQMTDFPGPRPS